MGTRIRPTFGYSSSGRAHLLLQSAIPYESRVFDWSIQLNGYWELGSLQYVGYEQLRLHNWNLALLDLL
jgi:hypothetical protein